MTRFAGAGNGEGTVLEIIRNPLHFAYAGG